MPAKAIQFIRSVPRWLLVRALGARHPGIATGALSCIQYAEVAPPPLPTSEWVRIQPTLSGICGSDLSTIACQGSPYFAPFVSTPFVLGHELVGEIVETGNAVPGEWKTGARVVIEPALPCKVRGVQPPCAPCAAGHYAHCENILKGSIKGGFQTGYCASTGGGWSESTLVAHYSQLFAVPNGMKNEEAVLAEPYSCALHSAFKIPKDAASTILILGCGAVGLLIIDAYRQLGGKGKILAVARYAHQAEMARKLGANDCFGGRGNKALYSWVLERSGPGSATGGIYQPEIGKPVLLGGVDVVVDCVGSSETIDDAMRMTRPRGMMILVGMPGIPKNVDWTSAWYKELRIQGAYAYGWEELPDGRRARTMQMALEHIQNSRGGLLPLVNRQHPLSEYREALSDAFNAGRRGLFKTTFRLS